MWGIDGEGSVEGEPLSLRREDEIDLDKLADPKVGQFDPTGAPHMGGDMWAGGTGG